MRPEHRAERDRVGPETLAASLRLLRHLLDQAVAHKRIMVNPAGEARAPTPPPQHEDRFLTRREAKMLQLRFCGVDRLMVDVFLGTGLRWEELAGLRVFRFDPRRGMLHVRTVALRDGTVKEYPKTAAGYRQVPLTTRLTRRLVAHVDAGGKTGRDLLFTGPGGGNRRRRGEGGQLEYNHWRSRVWAPAVAAAGLGDPQPTIHDNRHTYASWLAEAGMSMPDLAALLGHGSLRSVQRYAHAASSRFDRARDALGSRHVVGTGRVVDLGKRRAERARNSACPAETPGGRCKN